MFNLLCTVAENSLNHIEYRQKIRKSFPDKTNNAVDATALANAVWTAAVPPFAQAAKAASTACFAKAGGKIVKFVEAYYVKL